MTIKKILLSGVVLSSFLIGTTPLSFADDAHQASADTRDVHTQINDVVEQSRSELNGLNVGNGNFAVPETNENELQAAMRNAQERRRLQSLTALTNGAGALIAAQKEVSQTQYDISQIGKDKNKQSNNPLANYNPQGDTQSSHSDVQPHKVTAAETAEQEEEMFEEAERQSKMAEASKRERAEQIKSDIIRRRQDRKIMHERVMARVREVAGAAKPLVTSIFGPSFAPQANLLIPYMGEKTVYAGDIVTLIDNSKMKVISIDGEGVKVSHLGEVYRLSNGSHVLGRDALEGVVQSVQEDMSRNGDFGDLDVGSSNQNSDDSPLATGRSKSGIEKYFKGTDASAQGASGGAQSSQSAPPSPPHMILPAPNMNKPSFKQPGAPDTSQGVIDADSVEDKGPAITN